MRQALRLAARARGRTRPNPLVGAVLARGERVLGQGYHRAAGSEHAEVLALRRAGGRTRGTTMYVNLEPCDHVGRTGPCARAIIEAGVRRVVVGMQDPNPLVNGRGINALRRAGVKVTTGVLEPECRELNEPFTCYITRGRPLVVFKSALTLDGRVAARSGDARWVTGDEARRQAHRLRNTHDAIAVGVGTVLADDPRLTCRDVRGGRDPVRVVVDSGLGTPPAARVVSAAETSAAPTWIFCSERAGRQRQRALERAGARVIRLPGDTRQVDLRALVCALAEREITSLLLEGGPRLAGAFWQLELVDRVVAFVAPRVLADPGGLPMLVGGAADRMSAATDLTGVRVRRVGRDIMISGQVDRGREPGG
jgi:diaminohydroxyphosphoribosylaminopyrimidine deaminase/5-amino-6-(5-phosphoribosylamino)uracil reductase